eukprot:CAMPEP_0172810410 /NCGR_PEP_ID=MMETSP1075-20121228/8783_1 /TAXON_ID=2916 /ORGANISM="Ceratium fusus, Strain PA161109" /LENGTH=461 /DNA_ID=CAMNT_0013649717 /DNA_START=93 /DNA_END=1474 /DNA_ORIENTATION=+
MLLDISDYEGTTYPSIHERIEGLITEGAVRLEDDVAVLRKCRKDGRHSTSLVGPDWLKDNEPPLPMDNQRSDRSLDNSSSEHKFGTRLSAVEAMMTSFCGRIEAQLPFGRISGIENLVHNNHGELSCQIRSLNEAMDLGRMVSMELERKLDSIQLTKTEVEPHSPSQMLAEFQMQLDMLRQANRDAEHRAAAQEKSLTACMEASSQSVEALARRVDEFLVDATDGNEILAACHTKHMRNAVGEVSGDQDELTRTEEMLARMEAEVGKLTSHCREARCERMALQECFATVKIQADRLERETGLGPLGRHSDLKETLLSKVNRLESDVNMGLLGKLSDRIEMVAIKADQLEGQMSTGLLERLSERIELMEGKIGSCMSAEPRDVATANIESAMQLVSLLSERVDRFEKTANGTCAEASQSGKIVAGCLESFDKLQAELRAAMTRFSEWHTKLELEVSGVRDTL